MATSALQYHRSTGYDRHGMEPHYLDWQNQPRVYKTYSHVEPLSLPQGVDLPKAPLSSILKNGAQGKRTPPGLEDLSRIFLLTYSLTAKARQGGSNFFFRSVASAGALYPSEIYLASKGTDGLEDGLYHFSIAHHGLFRLRRGDLSSFISHAVSSSGGEVPSLCFFLSAIFFRSSWKYRARAYRYHLLDTGHLAENLLLALRAIGMPCILTYDFDDRQINRLLGLDENKEAALAVCMVPEDEIPGREDKSNIEDLPESLKNQSRMSSKEKDYPSILDIHRAGIGPRTQNDMQAVMTSELGVGPKEWRDIAPLSTRPETLNYSGSVINRRSSRNFTRDALPEDRVKAMLNCLCFNISGNALYRDTLCTGVLAERCEGLEDGFHLLNVPASSFGLVSPGRLNGPMARICLDQAWLANAALHFLFMTNLDRLDSHRGPRGYRYAMMTAGRMGERLYLYSTALGLGCCGIGAFYDSEASSLLGLSRPAGLLYLVAVGPVKLLRSRE